MIRISEISPISIVPCDVYNDVINITPHWIFDLLLQCFPIIQNNFSLGEVKSSMAQSRRHRFPRMGMHRSTTIFNAEFYASWQYTSSILSDRFTSLISKFFHLMKNPKKNCKPKIVDLLNKHNCFTNVRIIRIDYFLK